MESEEQDFRVDIDKILRDKLGNKSKFVPGFLVHWLKNILHQDFLNYYLAGAGKGLEGKEWLDGCLDYLGNRIKVQTDIDGVITEGLDALPGQVQAAGPLISRADAVLPAVAGDEVPAGIADDGDVQRAHEGEHVAAKAHVVRAGVAGLIDAGIDRAAEMLEKGAEQLRVDGRDDVRF